MTYNTKPPTAPTSNDPDDLLKNITTLNSYLNNSFAIGVLITRLPSIAILDKMVANNDRGQEGKLFYVSDGSTGTYYKTKLTSGNLAYEAF